MHLLLISLLTILTGVLLLAKFRKEGQGKFFIYISWFFVVVGFVLFVGFLCGSVYRVSHSRFHGRPGFRHEMMMKGPQGMMRGRAYRGFVGKGACCPQMMKGGECCREGMMAGKPSANMNCMKNDSLMKGCPARAAADSVVHK